MPSIGNVALVGAGPGHPGLLTLRGLELLQRAEVVIYDKLVSELLLAHAPEAAERVCVTDLGACHTQPDRHLPVHEAMIQAARAGKSVVRLKGGDPCLFGRGGEEAMALARAQVPFEIVPGVTAALGAAAYAGIPLTHRAHASAVAFVTGHENPAKPETLLDWDNLSRFPGTLVIYMGMSRLERIVATLLEKGKAPATPAAAVHWATSGEQRTIAATLSELPSAVRSAGLTAPALIIIGGVVELHAHLNWFEKLPLLGKRIMVTRPRRQAQDLVDRLVRLGATPVVLPAVEISPPVDWGPVDRALERLSDFDWLVFSSANGVSAFFDRLRHLGKDLRALGRMRLAAIGPKTAERLRDYHLDADIVPPRFQSEDLAAALLPLLTPGSRLLLARADRGRELLRDTLGQTAQVEQIAVYAQTDAVPEHHPALDQLRRGEIDYITLTSSNIARALLQGLDATTRQRLHEGHTRLVSISPVTSAVIRELGFQVAAEAATATMAGLVDALEASR